MKSLSEIEAAAANLPVEHKRQLVQFLLSHLQEEDSVMAELRSGEHSVLDIQPVKLGRILRVLDSDDDILDEMLEGSS